MIFNLSYGDTDYQTNYLFRHENKTIDEFKSDVNSLLIKYGEEYLASDKETWADVGYWIRFIVPKMSELGYERVITESYIFSGFDIIRKDNDVNDFVKVIGEELANKAYAHNDSVEKICDKQLSSLNENISDTASL